MVLIFILLRFISSIRLNKPRIKAKTIRLSNKGSFTFSVPILILALSFATPT